MLMEETDDPLAPEQTYHRLERRGVVGTPGRALPAPDGRHLYFASATAPVLFKLDVVAGEWVRGSDDPIELYEAGERALNRATIDDEGIVWVSAFNEERLYALDTRCDKPLGEPIELGASPEQLEGPLPLEVLRRGGTKEIYYATSLSEVLGRVTLN